MIASLARQGKHFRVLQRGMSIISKEAPPAAKVLMHNYLLGD
jgi:hypothetical protein